MITGIQPELLILLGVFVIWDLAWKGVALWSASKRDEKVWFVILLIVNSIGILPIIYLLLTKAKTHDLSIARNAPKMKTA